MITITPGTIPTAQFHGYLLAAVGPRPIAFASTVNEEGKPNLAPFSFFNVYSSNPPIMVFSANRRVRDNTTKHTLENILKTKEVVINIVNYSIVQQTSLASTEYAEGVNEFEKAGLTMLPSETVKPFRVAESPVQFECKVNEVIALGEEGGAGNLMICEVQKMHIQEDILDADGKIDQYKIDLVSRLGYNWYGRSNQGLFEVPKPLTTIGIGVDQLPEAIKNSTVLTGNNLGMLANITELPTDEEQQAFAAANHYSFASEEDKHTKAQEFLADNDVLSAWKVLLMETK